MRLLLRKPKRRAVRGWLISGYKWQYWCDEAPPPFPFCAHSRHPRHWQEPAWGLSSSPASAIWLALCLKLGHRGIKTVLAHRVVVKTKPVGTCAAHCLAESKCSNSGTCTSSESVSSPGKGGEVELSHLVVPPSALSVCVAVSTGHFLHSPEKEGK